MSETDKFSALLGMAATDVDLPAANFEDGAVGVRTSTQPGETATAFPSAMSLAATFDRTMSQRYGTAIGTEEKDHGFNGDDGPTVNLMRTPLGGRTFEAYGEDPYLAGQQATGWIDGLQSQGVMATIKHFIANDQEGQLGVSPLLGADGGRLITNVIVDDRTLHENDLRPFADAIAAAKPASVMCSYNKINSLFGCDNTNDLQTILRGQLGFAGLIQTDLGAAHTAAADLNAGVNWDILGNGDNPALIAAALADGSLTQATVDARVHEYLQTFFAYGLFDRPAYTDVSTTENRGASQATGVATEEEGATLLKNNGILPLTGRGKTIAVIGLPAENYVFGFGSSQVTPDHTVTLLQGIQARATADGDTVVYDDGTNVAQAQADAKAADVAIVIAADSETEGSDKLCNSLTPQCSPTATSTISPDNPLDDQAAWGDQDSLITSIASTNTHTVAVLETGGPVLTPWRGSLAGLLEAWYPGEDGGTAVAHVLWGDVDPGGRLPATFQASDDQEPTAGSTAAYPGVLAPQENANELLPTFYNETYTEGVLAGYRWFDQHDLTPAYPFGFGLSYSNFAVSDLHASRDKVTVTVTNTGTRAGTAVPETYVQLPTITAIPEPPAQLSGFDRVTLDPGASTTVSMTLVPRDFQYWDTAAQAWATVPGCPRILVGQSSRDLPLSSYADSTCGATTSTVTTAVAANAAAGTKTAKKSAKKNVKRVQKTAKPRITAPTQTLAFTGADPALPAAGLVLILGVALVRRRNLGGRDRP